MDLFSTCPSILEILRHVTYKDIRNCSALNRRISELVRNNRGRLPREEIDSISITRKQEKVKNGSWYASVAVFGCNISFNVWVTEGWTTLRKCPPFIKRYYQGSNCTENHGELSRSYSSNGVADGLHMLFSLFFRRYCLKELNLERHLPKHWLDAISSSFSKSWSKCQVIGVAEAMDGLRELIETFDCRILCESSYLSRWNDAYTCLSRVASLIKWNRDITIMHLSHVNFIQLWQDGELSLNRVEINEWSRYSGDHFSLLEETIRRFEGHLKHGTADEVVRLNKTDSPIFRSEIHITRPIDSKILILVFANKNIEKKITFREYWE